MPPKKYKADGKYYLELVESWKEAYPQLKRKTCTDQATLFWNTYRSWGGVVENKLTELRLKKEGSAKAKPILLAFQKQMKTVKLNPGFGGSKDTKKIPIEVVIPVKPEMLPIKQEVEAEVDSDQAISLSESKNDGETSQVDEVAVLPESPKEYEYATPAQDKCKIELKDIHSKLTALASLKVTLNEEQHELFKSLQDREIRVQRQLKRLQFNQKSNQKLRERRAEVFERMKIEHGDALKRAGFSIKPRRGRRGRPNNVETKQPGLHSDV